jgi:hypothetical protein
LAESTEGELPLAEGETSRARLHVRLGLEAPVSHESSLKSTAFSATGGAKHPGQRRPVRDQIGRSTTIHA